MEHTNVYDELVERGLVAQATHPEEIRELLGKEKVTFYVGFDATADSLHLGHFLPIKIMMHLQQAGHRPIALLGTGTTLVGDPTGRTDMRKMLTQEQINDNAKNFERQISKYVDFSDDKKGMVLRNGDWLLKLKYLDFLRDVGTHFSVNRMLTAESVKTRLETGLSFIEFNYMIMQSYDFLELHRTHGCKLQVGGNDQWSNVIGGVDLVRRVDGDSVYGFTMPLLVKGDGTKMGKTAGGALWIDPERTSPYEFYQYLRNVDDSVVIDLLKYITFIPMDKIREMEEWQGTSKINDAKEILAYEVTKIIHGEDEAEKAQKASKALFADGDSHENAPTIELSKDDFTGGEIDIVTLLVKSELASSKSEAKRLLTQGGITVDDEKMDSPEITFKAEKFEGEGVLARRGKKIYKKIIIK